MRFEASVCLFEFNAVSRVNRAGVGVGSAISPLRDRGYADKCADLGEPIHLIGVEFSRENRNVAGFVVEDV